MAGRSEDEGEWVVPDGLSVRRRRHKRAWSPRDFVDAIGLASERSSGLRETISPTLLSGIEEKNERIPYETLRLLADGLDCDPVDILGNERTRNARAERRVEREQEDPEGLEEDPQVRLARLRREAIS